MESGNLAHASQDKRVVLVNTFRMLISEQLLALEARIRPSNKPGDVDGLFARFILGSKSTDKWSWEVDCSDNAWVQDHAAGLNRGNYTFLSALGFSLSISALSKRDSSHSAFTNGMEALQKRELFPTDGVSFPNMPRIFMGLASGVNSIPDVAKKTSFSQWLIDVLDQVAARKSSSKPGLTYVCIRSLLTTSALLVEPRDLTSLTDLALLDWGLSHRLLEVKNPPEEIPRLREQLVNDALGTDAQQFDAGQAALLWYSLHHALTVSVHELLVSPSHVSLILSHFEDAMRRWRWDSDQVKHPIRWTIREEREIQDVVWMMLRPVFSDLIDEDTLHKLGHSSYKADFGIPSLGMLIEVKMARRAEDFKTIEKEIMEDSRGYLANTSRYNRILVFIYDDSASVQEHGITTQALMQLPEISNVVIVSRPSHLPSSSSMQTGSTTKRGSN